MFDFRGVASGKRLPVERFDRRRLHWEVVGRFFWLDLDQSGDAYAAGTILRCGSFSFPEEGIALYVSEAWVPRRWLRGIGGRCHCWWMFEVGVV